MLGQFETLYEGAEEMKIDWIALWQEERKKRSWQGKKKQDWNRRAAGFARRNTRSPYIDALLAKISIAPDETVLDVGSGPGTLSIPLAAMVKQITALDFSREMLDILQERISQENITNITIVEGSWEDDWRLLGLKTHDVVMASRSLAVQDLGGALVKLNDWAEKKVIISDRVGNGPFDPAMFAAVGREFYPGPDYIFTLNILHQMGIHARLDFISSGGLSRYTDKQEAMDAWSWMLDLMTPEEEKKFVAHMESRLVEVEGGAWELKNQVVPKWAVIQWDKRGCSICG